MSKRKKQYIKNRVILTSMAVAAAVGMFTYQVNTPVCAISTSYAAFVLLVNCLTPSRGKVKKHITVILHQNCEVCKGAMK